MLHNKNDLTPMANLRSDEGQGNGGYQQILRDNQAKLTVYVGAAVISSLVIELLFGVFAIMRRRRAKRDLFKGATTVKVKQVNGPL